jgi:glycosyltransferase involved in cell wall biosynthesis
LLVSNVRGFTPHKNHIWLDVGDLLSWEHPSVTGIQRVMASLAAQLLKPRSGEAPVRFCKLLNDVGFIELSSDTVRRCVARLLDEEPSLLTEGLLRRARAEARRWGLAVLRRIYGPLSRIAEPRPHEPPVTVTARTRRMARSVEIWCLRKALRADAIFQDNDILLNIGSGWWQKTYTATLAAIKRKTKLRHVALVYDMIPWRRPEYFPDTMPPQFIEWAQATLISADNLLTISNCSRQDMLAFAKEFDLPDKPISVIRLGRERTAGSEAALPDELTRTAAGFVLSVGTVEARKNHILLVRTWSELLRRHGRALVPHLVWVGRSGWMIDALLDELDKADFLDGKLLWLGKEDGLPDSTLHGLYRGCLFTMFPSVYEGWGLPVSESLAHGKLCIASSASSIPEAGGDLADYHGPQDLEKCLALTERAIFDPNYRKARERRIRKEHKMPSWAECSHGIIEACKR